MKDKAKEQEYKAEGLKRCRKRKEKRLDKLRLKIKYKHSFDNWDDEDW
ncbi:hypothetical protein HGB07_07870 [Candidatus Roizmanbacteria bacterium]|nr:hypothetical protein [Candidatus Roizmanbacteria bacterium]